MHLLVRAAAMFRSHVDPHLVSGFAAVVWRL